ncbi:MAG: SDR family NAD(P)-dependent oxidoreductase [Candidatus Aenigmarchaeota archaeon]|nr:SDR family NAD(P)-dependent oxidoreductase [Candidatus Aenigmarchaeota archaeon]
MEKVLVTGGAGFIGSHLVSRLCESDKEIVVLDNSWRGSLENLGDFRNRIKFVEGDIRDYSVVKKAMEEVGTVFHLASIQGTKFFYTHPDLILEVGLIGNLNVARAIVENKVKRLLFTSSSEVYGQPRIFPTPENHEIIVPDIKNPRWSYSVTKIAGESIFLNFAKKYGFDSTLVRIHNAYGPKMGWEHVIPEFIRRVVLNEKFTIQGNGTETRSFCYVSDIVDGILLAASKEEGKNEIFNLGNDKEEYRILDLVKLLSNVSGKKIEPIQIDKLEGSTSRRIPDISKARMMLGYDPKVKLSEGLKLAFDWYKSKIESIIKYPSKPFPWERG